MIHDAKQSLIIWLLLIFLAQHTASGTPQRYRLTRWFITDAENLKAQHEADYKRIKEFFAKKPMALEDPSACMEKTS